MIYHCIRFTVKPGVPPEEVAAGLELMREQSKQLPLKSWVVGPDIGGEYDYGAVSVIEDLESYEVMMNHPAHLEIDRLGLPLIDKFMSFDITDDPDPQIAEKITEVHQRRFESVPGLAELVSDLGEYVGSAAPGKHGS